MLCESGRGDRGELETLGCGELRYRVCVEGADEDGERVLALLEHSSSLALAHAAGGCTRKPSKRGEGATEIEGDGPAT